MSWLPPDCVRLLLRHVVTPLSRPTLITVGVFSAPFEMERLAAVHLGPGAGEVTGLYTSQWHLLMAGYVRRALRCPA